MIMHFIGVLNRAHQDEKSDILHGAIFKVFAEIWHFEQKDCKNTVWRKTALKIWS